MSPISLPIVFLGAAAAAVGPVMNSMRQHEGLDPSANFSFLILALGTLVSVTLDPAHLLVAVSCSLAFILFQNFYKPRLSANLTRQSLGKQICSSKGKAPAAATSKQRQSPKCFQDVTPRSSAAPLAQRRPQVVQTAYPAELNLPDPKSPYSGLVRQASKVPVLPPFFQASSLSGQVEELLLQISPSPESQRVASELVLHARKSIQDIFPNIEVAVFVIGDVLRGTAFGVAVPEIDMVATADPEDLIHQLQGRLSKGGLSKARVDERKLQKSAIRACTDQLVAGAGFKFRRSAFRCQEPKVTLMASAALGVSGQGIPVDFSVNSTMPLFHSTLITACGRLEPRAQDLALLVRRWAKDRGVCHAARGHLPPYAWTLMVVFYLQVGLDESPLLPPLRGRMTASGLTVSHEDIDSKDGGTCWKPSAAKHTVADLFKGFIGFYNCGVDFSKEAISVRRALREPIDDPLMQQMVIHDDGRAEAAPRIEDPFEPSRNFGSNLSSEGLQRLKEELARTDRLLIGGEEASLSDILIPWAPPERGIPVAERPGSSSPEDIDRAGEESPETPDTSFGL
eukprot:TRINITY_DN51405_c0_g1_i1.p1 TRINITY_DN51405_c0_g1~~TRINITY_DN51405_c0_g1_i1.p1  ORF type:complete len:568 (-),score=107.08 TRINITY_DN51405_c0_g1_i1:62-1765(-)